MPGLKFIAKYGIDSRGDILTTGLVDGVDISLFKTSYDNHSHTLSSLSEKSYNSLTDKPSVGDGGFSEINFTTALYNKLNNIEALADVTDATNVAAAGALMKTTFNANTIIAANSDDTPLALTVTEGTIVGRTTGGQIDALSATEVRNIINVANGADQTSTSNVTAAGAVMKSFFIAGTFLYASTSATPVAKNASEVRSILNVEDGANNYTHPSHTGEVTGSGALTIANNVVDADNIMGNSAALGAGTPGQVIIAGSTSKRFAYATLGAAAYKDVVTSISSSSDLPTASAVMSYVDDQLSGLGKVRPGVSTINDLKALSDNTDKDMVLVESVGLYRYDSGAADSADDNLIVAPNSGGGRWFKMSSTINEHANLDAIDKWNGSAANTYHVPNVSGNTSEFLRGDGTWATPSYYTHPSHTGDVTGSGVLTITNDVVTNAKLANMANGTIKGRVTASTGDPEDLSATQVRTLLNVENGANNYTHPSDGGGSRSSLSGASVISGITVNTAGHVTATTIRDITLANLGYTGATNANYYVHPNHTGEVTSSGDGALSIASNIISPNKLKGPASGALSNGINGNVLQSAGDGTFKWGTAADPSQVAYTYGESSSFIKTSIGVNEVLVHSFAKATYRSIKYILSITDITNSRYETVEITATHDGTNVYYNTYGSVDTGVTPGVSFVVTVNGADIELKATGTSTNNTVKGIYYALYV